MDKWDGTEGKTASTSVSTSGNGVERCPAGETFSGGNSVWLRLCVLEGREAGCPSAKLRMSP
ncbi:hypothetical protein E2C01_080122 [Portunus trituberculatus]|uniref:Uncharacterized protein n=1 Tax=Portunus trituberculatus TaxID=210409 RepID=A0A5B7INF8_PORTR|nr:hypothetical protein [Portunus trituberculatus]